MRKDTSLAREDSELRIRPIVFVRNIALDADEDGNIKGIKLAVVNAGLGPALNVSVTLKSDITVPGTGATLRREMLSQSSIIQVLPNAEGNLQGNLSVTVNGDSATIDLSRAQLLPNEYTTNVANAAMSVLPRPDGQAQLKLESLQVSKEALESAFADALFQVQCTSMTNKPVTYENRAKRSDTLRKIET